MKWLAVGLVLLATVASAGTTSVLGNTAAADGNGIDTYFIFPDTQSYANDTIRGDDLETIGQWVCDNKVTQNIKAVLGVGDIVQDGSVAAEWTEFQDVRDNLEACTNGNILYVPTFGNHDSSPVIADAYSQDSNATLYQQNVGKNYIDSKPWFGQRSNDRGDIRYQEAASFQGRSFTIRLTNRLTIIAAEFGFTMDSIYAGEASFCSSYDPVRPWVTRIANETPDSVFFLITHSGPCSSSNCGLWSTDAFSGGCSNGTYAQTVLREGAKNILAYISGHLGGGCALGGGQFDNNTKEDGTPSITGMFDFNSVCETRGAGTTAYSWTGWLRWKRLQKQVCLQTLRVIDASATPATNLGGAFLVDRTDNSNDAELCVPIVLPVGLR